MAIVQLLKDLLGIAKAVNNFELNQKLVELQQELMQLQDENRTLKDRVREMEDQRKKGEEVVCANDAYWQEKGAGWDGPFCTGCFDSKGQLVRLTKLEEAFRAIATHHCPVCRQPCSPKEPSKQA